MKTIQSNRSRFKLNGLILLYRKNVSQHAISDRQNKLYPQKNFRLSHSLIVTQNIFYLTANKINDEKRSCDKKKRIVVKSGNNIKPNKRNKHS